MITGKGILVECKEDLEVLNLDITFKKDILYTALLEQENFVIDRQHKPLKVTNQLFNRHFKIKN